LSQEFANDKHRRIPCLVRICNMSLKRAQRFMLEVIRNKKQKCDSEEISDDSTAACGPNKPIQTFVFLDLEATGLPESDGTLPDITELAMTAIARQGMTGNSVKGAIPRIQDKLLLCLTPQKDVTPTAEKMTGLSKQLLEKHCKRKMDLNVDGALRYFLRRQTPPVCLVSHAGDRFDFPVLRAELDKVDSVWDCIYTIDSLKFFQYYMPKQNRSLPNLCKRFLGFETDHNAEGDVTGLVLLLSSCTFADTFLDWAQENAIKF
ncbi:three-prime repair exonuclease 1-like, partial [Saccoglossus kowalevskii]|uniref:Three prime repair exonuclease 1-like n=1 Tax=Saccoglossus kowalevskii TaxID=10224 RepID=A0ABM0GSG2_SACKO